MKSERKTGILVYPTSIPGDYFIKTIGKNIFYFFS